uniref:SDR family oxidoreductase n=1 Tax=candidate division CPR3 bacterium TaxID=2268181 RepID=A0A7V3N455_UNCC3
MKILITGALGHIGSKLIHDIRAGEYDEVVLLDNLSTQRYASLFNLPSGVKFRFYEEDILKADLKEFLKGIDVVIHLAAITDAASSFDKKDLVEEVNYKGTERVAKACLANNCRLIFPSTTSVYGSQSELVDESCGKEDLKPQSPYAESKLKAEELLHQLGHEKGLKYVICRFGTIFGISVGMRFHTAINKFCWQAVMKQPITVWRTAYDQKRPYLDLKDAVAAIKFIIDSDLFDQNVYNVVTLNATVRNIIDNIRVHIPEISIKYVDTQIMNQLSYEVSNQRLLEKGFKPKGELAKGIAETIYLLKNAFGGD